MSDVAIDELKRRFLIDETSYRKETLRADLERLVLYCKITSQGSVLITAKGLPDKKKIGLTIIARYVGNKLEQSVPEAVSGEEIAANMNIDKAILQARTEELVDEGYVLRDEAGKYRANPGKISDFLNRLRFDK